MPILGVTGIGSLIWKQIGIQHNIFLSIAYALVITLTGVTLYFWVLNKNKQSIDFN